MANPTITIRLDPSLHNAVYGLSWRTRRTVTDIVVAALRAELARQGVKVSQPKETAR